jgi:hypothetical protein
MNFPRGLRLGNGAVIVLPGFVVDMAEARLALGSDKASNLTIGQWLAAQPPAVQHREGFRVLRKMGLRPR